MSEAANELRLLATVRERTKECAAEGKGFWRTCSGCYETEDGQNVHGYPHSNDFGCVLGSGCDECGGIGALWDTMDYTAMGEAMSWEPDATAELTRLRAIVAAQADVIRAERVERSCTDFWQSPFLLGAEREGQRSILAVAQKASQEARAALARLLAEGEEV